jgi:hypothetical protein
VKRTGRRSLCCRALKKCLTFGVVSYQAMEVFDCCEGSGCDVLVCKER